MSRWFRVDDALVDDPKVQQLPDRLFRAVINLWCITSQCGGDLPPIEQIAFKLRVTPTKANLIIEELRRRGLIDDDEAGGCRPHNWNGRQFKSDVSTDRVQQFRKRRGNVSSAVSETPPEPEDRRTEAKTEKKEPSLRSDGASAPRDIRADLFGRGLKTLASITGKTPDSVRSLVGRWLKSVNDEAIHVLGAIDDAERNHVADPVAWINKVLASHGAKNGHKRTVHDAANDLLERVRAFDEPVPSGLRDEEGAGAVRRLPAR